MKLTGWNSNKQCKKVNNKYLPNITHMIEKIWKNLRSGLYFKSLKHMIVMFIERVEFECVTLLKHHPPVGTIC